MYSLYRNLKLSNCFTLVCHSVIFIINKDSFISFKVLASVFCTSHALRLQDLNKYDYRKAYCQHILQTSKDRATIEALEDTVLVPWNMPTTLLLSLEKAVEEGSVWEAALPEDAHCPSSLPSDDATLLPGCHDPAPIFHFPPPLQVIPCRERSSRHLEFQLSCEQVLVNLP